MENATTFFVFGIVAIALVAMGRPFEGRFRTPGGFYISTMEEPDPGTETDDLPAVHDLDVPAATKFVRPRRLRNRLRG